MVVSHLIPYRSTSSATKCSSPQHEKLNCLPMETFYPLIKPLFPEL